MTQNPEAQRKKTSKSDYIKNKQNSTQLKKGEKKT